MYHVRSCKRQSCNLPGMYNFSAPISNKDRHFVENLANPCAWPRSTWWHQFFQSLVQRRELYANRNHSNERFKNIIQENCAWNTSMLCRHNVIKENAHGCNWYSTLSALQIRKLRDDTWCHCSDQIAPALDTSLCVAVSVKYNGQKWATVQQRSLLARGCWNCERSGSNKSHAGSYWQQRWFYTQRHPYMYTAYSIQHYNTRSHHVTIVHHTK